MTGFGKAESIGNGMTVATEISSVNGRFLDLRVKMPKSLSEYENELRKIAQNHVNRGRVIISINVDQAGSRGDQMQVDYELAERYLSLADELSSRYGIENNMDARTVLSLPEMIGWDENGYNAETVWDMIRSAIESAFEAHREMREQEGLAIGEDIHRRLEAIAGIVDVIELRIPAIIEANTGRLRKKIESLVGPDLVEEGRFATEVAIYADRIDITEECVRLRSHCDQFGSELSAETASGRKLSFLLQEMNRETNTIGSKIMDAEVSQLVVRIKEELEKMREQAENME